jgi:hypothetical protein
VLEKLKLPAGSGEVTIGPPARIVLDRPKRPST